MCRLKRFLSVVLLAMIFTNIFTACGNEDQNIEESKCIDCEYKEEIIIGIPTEINNLDLQRQNDSVNNTCLKLTHEVPIFYTNEGTFEPFIFKDWTFIDDNRIRVKVNDGVCFSNGMPLTVEDIKFTYDMALEVCPEMLTGLNEVKIVDEHLMDFMINGYSNEFIQLFTSVPLSIQSKAAYESDMDKPYLIGSGPYKLKEWDKKSHITFERNEKYWGKLPKTKYITFRTIENDRERSNALINGEIDVCIDPSVEDIDTLTNAENITIEEKQGTRIFYLGFNYNNKPWDNRLLREAVCHAINREEIVESLLDGKATIQNTVLNPTLFGYYDGMEGYQYNVELAKEKLLNSGYSQTEPLEILISSESYYEDLSQMLKGYLEKIGLETSITTLSREDFQNACIEGKQGLFIWRWNEDIMTDLVYRPLYYTNSQDNYFHYSDELTDRLIDAIYREKDQNRRKEKAKSLQIRLVDSCIELPLYVKNVVIAYNNDLQNTYLYSGANHDWRYVFAVAHNDE